jgi:hypothetical protein
MDTHYSSAKGLGVPQSTGVSHTAELFNEVPARNIGISALQSEGNSHINNLSAGTDSKVSAAGADGGIEIAGGASVSLFYFIVSKRVM